MSEAKEKDRILAQIKARTHHSEIVGLNKHIDEFVKEGNAVGQMIRYSYCHDTKILKIN